MTDVRPPYFAPDQPWGYFNPVRLTVGRGCRAGLLDQVRAQTLLVVTSQRGRQQFQDDHLLRGILQWSEVFWVDSIVTNPGLADLQGLVDALSTLRYDAAIGFGGGSAIDAAKVLNLMLSLGRRDRSIFDMLSDAREAEGVLVRPLYALPTTTGTGTEVTPFATVWDHEQKRKYSVTGSRLFPAAALVDADLAEDLSLEITISTGLDAINQAAESIWNRNANGMSLATAIRALQLGFTALPRLVVNSFDAQAREHMAEAAVLAGLAISQTRTALCHSISYPLTAHFGVPHGLACAFTMPAVLRHNLAVDDGRFARIAEQLLGAPDGQRLLSLFTELNELCRVRERVKAHIPALGALLDLRDQMLTPGRADNNLAPVGDLAPILRDSWGA